MKIRLNKAGVALVLVLMIVVISAGLLSAIMYYALSGSEISGLQRKYETSKEASLGAIDILTKELIPKVLQQQTTGLSGVAAALTQGTGIVNSIASNSSQNACFLSKLTSLPLPSTGTWVGCVADDTKADPTINPDITFKLLSASGSKPFVVETKIIDTLTGNSNMSGVVLEGSGVVAGGGGMITTRHFPYLYTITTEAKPQNSTTERANYEILYAY